MTREQLDRLSAELEHRPPTTEEAMAILREVAILQGGVASIVRWIREEKRSENVEGSGFYTIIVAGDPLFRWINGLDEDTGESTRVA